MNLLQLLLEKKTSLAVIGLGYVGLPVALAFAKKVSVIGYDVSESKISMMSAGEDPGGELDADDFFDCDIEYTSDPSILKGASFYVVAVPTPIDQSNIPDLSYLVAATKTVGENLKAGDYVIYESTVYPGATEEVCIPVLEEVSGLKVGKDFKVGYSPERINPGDKVHSLKRVVKVVSGCDTEALETIAELYHLIIEEGVHEAPCIKVAEAAKIIENTQRDVNIALMNELSIIFNKMGINTNDVLRAAGTKWNFLKFYPGLVGGHCIGVDPYYLAFQARRFKYHPQVINSGRYVNDSMGYYVAKQTVKKMIVNGKNIFKSRALIMGVTFKEDVSDIRNSRVFDIIEELNSYGVNVDCVDPQASSDEIKKEYGLQMCNKLKPPYDAIIVAVAHKEYKALDRSWFDNMLAENGLLVDVKGIYRGEVRGTGYWRL